MLEKFTEEYAYKHDGYFNHRVLNIIITFINNNMIHAYFYWIHAFPLRIAGKYPYVLCSASAETPIYALAEQVVIAADC